MYNNLSLNRSLQFHPPIDSHVTGSDVAFLLDPKMDLFVVEKTHLDGFALYGKVNTRFRYSDSYPHDLSN